MTGQSTATKRTSIYRVEFTGLDATGTPKTFRYATKAYATTPAHATLPNTFFPGRVIQPLLFRRDMYGQGRTFGDVEIGHGEIVLQNADGGLDALRNYAFGRQRVAVYRVEPKELPLATALDRDVQIFEGVTEEFSLETRRVRLLVRDTSYLFDAPLQTNRYGGTNVLPNGFDGGADIAGRVKPLIFGEVKQIEPVLVNSSRLIYQVHDGSLGTSGSPGTITVYDMLYPFTTGAPYTSQADMEANPPGPATIRMWWEGGMFRTGTPFLGKVTADVLPSGAEANRFDTIFTAVLARAGSFRWRNECDSGSVAGIFDVTKYRGGFYWDDTITILDALREVLRMVNGTMGVYPVQGTAGDPFVLVNRISTEYRNATELYLFNKDLIKDSLERVVASDEEHGIPPQRFDILYIRQYSPTADSEITGNVSEADRQKYGREYASVMSITNSAVLAQFPKAPVREIKVNLKDPFVDTVLGNGLSYYLKKTYSAKREIFTASIPSAKIEPILQVYSTGYDPDVVGPRLGMFVRGEFSRFSIVPYSGDTRSNFMLIGYALDLQRGVCDLTLWGAFSA